jgi:site-specific DNA-methyltransferase (adenine-specific)
MNSAVMFSSASDSWATPRAVYDALNAEFGFTLDPCPLDESDLAGASLWGRDGTQKAWAGERVFCNPPYSDIRPWLSKAREAALAVFLVPARTDTRWWHDLAMKADEIRFLRGRLKFGDAKNSAPFPSVLLIFRDAADHGDGK